MKSNARNALKHTISIINVCNKLNTLTCITLSIFIHIFNLLLFYIITIYQASLKVKCLYSNNNDFIICHKCNGILHKQCIHAYGFISYTWNLTKPSKISNDILSSKNFVFICKICVSFKNCKI